MPATADDLRTRYPLPREAIAHFRRDGFVKLRDVLSPETLAAYGERFSALVRARDGRRPMAGRSIYAQAFLQIMNLWREDEMAHEFVCSPRLARIAAELMGVDGVRLYHDQALYKEPGGGFTPWHTDQSVWPIASPNCCTVWVPFQTVPLAMGPLAFLVGSHRARFIRDLEVSRATKSQSDDADALPESRLDEESEALLARTLADLPHEQSPFALGEVSFHYGRTFHHAGPNRTEAMRAVMTMIYLEDGLRLTAPRTRNQRVDLEAWFPGARPGDPAATSINPLLWPAADRDLARTAALDAGNRWGSSRCGPGSGG